MTRPFPLRSPVACASGLGRSLGPSLRHSLRLSLGLSIGLFFYLVFDGAWARTTLFWWPLFGAEADAGDIPGWESPAILVVMELIGAAALVWAARRYDLRDPERRELFLREGRLDRRIMSAPPGTC